MKRRWLRNSKNAELGRPSTYAAILSTIQERNMRRKLAQVHADGDRVCVTDLLVENFRDIFDLQYTCQPGRRVGRN